MFNVFRKNSIQKSKSQWNKTLQLRILPEAEYYYSTVNTFNKSFVEEEVHQTFSPHFSVNDYLNTALYLTYANFDKQVAIAYFKVALKIANKILELSQNETKRWNDEDLFTDLFKPIISIDKIFLDAVLTDETIDNARLFQFSVDLLENFKTYKGTLWEDVTQSRYILNVWNLIIAGQFQDAKMHLNIKKKFSYVEDLFNWTVQINTLLIAQQSGDKVDAELKQIFDDVFNTIRSPYWKTNEQKEENKFPITMNADYVRFQLAIIRWLYIEKQSLTDHWSEVLAQVSK